MQKNKSVKSYSAAPYYRLSEEDIDLFASKTKQESDSISNQKILISQYLNNAKENIVIHDTYIDDGFTGTNFERPAFKLLMEDIHQGLVNMVIVKDLSRFGRDYVEVGKYVKKVFPQLNVRFVSILDNFDSLTATPNDYNLLLPVKNFVNESYSRDISQKVRGNMDAMRLDGVNVSAHPPYGYKKSAVDKSKLVIDEDAARIVRNIFKWKLKGISNQQIADKLNAMKIPTPAEHKRKNSNYKTPFIKKYIPVWYINTVIRIMENKTYIGTLEQGKRKRISYKVRKDINVPSSEWKVCEREHEPIISEKDFQSVQRLLKRDLMTVHQKDSAYLFSGFLYCGDCGRSMVRRIVKYKDTINVYYICNTYNQKKGCTRHSISEKNLYNIVMTTVNKHIETLVSMEAIINEINVVHVRREEMLVNSKEIQGKLDEIVRYKKLSASLYKDMVERLITEEEFHEYKDFYDMQAQGLEESIQQINNNMKELLGQGAVNTAWIEAFKIHKNIQKLNRSILIELIDKIVIYEDDRLDICFTYSDQYKALEIAIESRLTAEVV